MFQKAARKNVPFKGALIGPSGSGKTESALRLMRGLVGPDAKIGVIDTENDSASLYADRYDFDSCPLYPPFTVEKFRAAIEAGEKAGYAGIILDSISQQWAGEGGLLEVKGKLDAGGKGNSYTNWNTITPKHEQFKNDILYSPVHILCTIRAKQGYILVENSKGKQEPKKIGMEPIQRDNLEYEFTTVFDIDMNHTATSSKDRTNLFSNSNGPFQITEETGRQIKEWLESGATAVMRPKPPVEQQPQSKTSTRPPPLPPSSGGQSNTRAPAPIPFIENKADISLSFFTFGPHRNKKLKDINPHDLDEYLIKLDDELKSTNRKKPDWLVKAEETCATWLNICMTTPMGGGVEQPGPTEDAIPE